VEPMKKEFGDVLKEIRIDRGYSQKYVAEGIMGQSAYSKIERSEIEPTFRKWLAILEKLNISVDEFRYILNKENLTTKEKIINEFFALNYNHLDDLRLFKDEIVAFLKEEEDYLLKDIFYACESLIVLNTTQNVEEAQYFAKKIWERLEKFDRWYLLDIRLINTILFIFPVDVAVHIGERATKQLIPYNNLKEADILLINIEVNLAVLLIDEQKYPESLSYLEKVIPLCKKYQKYSQLAIAYARKGIILQKTGEIDEGSESIEKAYSILNAIEDMKLIDDLGKELSHYLNQGCEGPLQLEILQ
jgi:Rgg/GadR/MutR family transcriptional activator